MRVLDAAAIAAALTPSRAADVLETELHAGLDPEADTPRSAVPAAAGELLVMPSAVGAVGVKLVSITPGNPGRGLPRVQGVHVVFEPETLTPVAVLDGAALTALRTAAVSALAVRFLAAPDASRLLVWGTGPQAWAHVEAVAGERPIARVDVAGRDRGRLAVFVELCHEAGLAARVAGPGAVAVADVICCCTTAREPLFDGARVAEDATVVAVGSHEPTARELDEGLVGRGTVVVDGISAALREAGDVLAAIEAGTLQAGDLVPLAALVRGEAFGAEGRPRVFKSVGMAWQDAAVAAALLDRSERG